MISVILLALMEVALRLFGFSLLYSSNKLNQVLPEDFFKIRILAVGESTTADYFANGKAQAWPRLLEDMLKKNGINARVYNEGLGGTASPMILSKIPDLLEKYKPHIVISMMGINDDETTKFENTQLSKFSIFLSQIRLFKVFQWSKNLVASSFKCKIEYDQENNDAYWKMIDDGFELSKTQSAEQVEMYFRKFLLDDRKLALALTDIAFKVRGNFDSIPQEIRSRPYTTRAFELYPFNRKVAYWHLNGSQVTPEICADAAKKLLPCGNTSDDLLHEIALCSVGSTDEFLQTEMKNHGFSRSDEKLGLKTFHYRSLFSELQSRNIFYLAMQYPTLPLENLKSYFSDKTGAVESQFREINFISNEDNFNEYLKFHSYDEVFRDHFRGSWGHTTDIGYQLIADSAFKATLSLLQSPRFKESYAPFK